MGMGLMGQAAAGFASGFGAGMVDSIKSEREHGEAMQRMGYANDLAMGREKELLRLKDEMEQLKQKRIAQVLGSVKRTEPMGPPTEAGDMGARDIGDVEFARRRTDALSNAGLMDAAGREEERAMRYEDKAEGRRIREEQYKREDETKRWTADQNAKMRAALAASRSAGRGEVADSDFQFDAEKQSKHAAALVGLGTDELKMFNDETNPMPKEQREKIMQKIEQRNALLSAAAKLNVPVDAVFRAYAKKKEAAAAVGGTPAAGSGAPNSGGAAPGRDDSAPKERGIFSEGGGMKEVPMSTIKKFMRGGLMGRGGVYGPD